jgi:cytochrome P450
MSTLEITNSEGHIRPEVLSDPYHALYDPLREEDPVHFDRSLGGWMLVRHADVRAAVTDPRLSSERTQAYLSELPSVDRDRFRRFIETRSDMLLFCDGPKHTRVRRVVVGAIRSISRRQLRATVQTRAEGLLDELRKDETVDLIGDYALPLPIAVLIDLLGVPAADAPKIQAWAMSFNLAIGGVIRPVLVEEAQEAVEEVSVYLDYLLRTGGGQSPLLEHLRYELQAGNITSSEMHASCLMLITAGHETVSNLLGNSLLALLRNPTQLERLRADPGRIFTGLDELMRYDAPVQLTAREAKSALIIGGKEIEAGQRVIPIWGAANHDPTVFSSPGMLDLERFKPNRQVGFGSGRHRCVGASLARDEADVALTALLRRLHSLELAEAPVWKENFSFRGLQRLRVGVAPA